MHRKRCESSTRGNLRAYLACGVTTVLDAGIDPAGARDIQEWLARGHPGPRFLTTGPYVRPPGGYGWEGFGSESTVNEVEAKLDALQSLGAAGVKLAFDEGPRRFLARAPPSHHSRDRPAETSLYIHATTEKTQREALDWGAHAIMHAALRRRVERSNSSHRPICPTTSVRQMKSNGAYQVTTFSLRRRLAGTVCDRPARRAAGALRHVPAVELATAQDPRAVDAFVRRHSRIAATLGCPR